MSTDEGFDGLPDGKLYAVKLVRLDFTYLIEEVLRKQPRRIFY